MVKALAALVISKTVVIPSVTAAKRRHVNNISPSSTRFNRSIPDYGRTASNVINGRLQISHIGKEWYASVNGIKIWYAVFGRGTAVILLHGGLANANYWGELVPVLDSRYWVVVMDSREYGRISRDARPFGYDLMGTDVLALMDFLKIDKPAVVGWSDGAIIGLDIAMHHPDRLSKLFAFAANSDPSGVKDVNQSPVFTCPGQEGI